MSTSSAQASDKSLEIRKYPNRRYYDATHSRHLTLEEIRSFIGEGYDINVTDSKTGADITAQVLTQIILELDTPKIDSFPVALLLRMIRSNDQAVRDFVETYFNQAFKAYSEYQKPLEERMRQLQNVMGMFPPFGAWSQAMMAPFGSTPVPPEAKAAPAAAPVDNPDEQLRSVVADLQRQLAKLQAQVKAAQPTRRNR